jgi:hypothetical protein
MFISDHRTRFIGLVHKCDDGVSMARRGRGDDEGGRAVASFSRDGSFPTSTVASKKQLSDSFSIVSTERSV